MNAMIPRVTQDYLQNGASKGNRNHSLMEAVCQLRDARYSQGEAEAVLIPRGLADGLTEPEIKATIKSAFGRAPRDPVGTGCGVDPHAYAPKNGKNPPPPVYRKVPVEPERLPNPLDNGAIRFLETKFEQGEFVSIGKGYERTDKDGNVGVAISKGEARSRETWIGDIKLRGIDAVFPSADGLFVRVNPMKDGTGSTDKDVSVCRDVLVESDEGDLEEQLGAIRLIGLPIVTLAFSGDRSVQAHVRIDADDEETYRERFGILREYCVESLGLKMDAKNINPSRYSRLPGGKRFRRDHDTGKKILDDNGKPIIDAQTLLAINLAGKPWEEWEKKLRPPLIEFLSPSEIKAYKARPGTLLVGDNHIVRGGVFVIGGSPGVGKSRTAVGLAEAGATKLDWLGLPVHCNFRTLIIQNENGRFRLQMEFEELNHELLDKYLRISPPPPFGLRFDKLDFRDQIKAYIDTWPPGVVILDPWNAVAKDDKQKDYRETFDLIREVVPAGDEAPALGILAHTRKPLPNERTNGRSLLNLLAGSHVLASIPRSIWVVQHASDDVNEKRVVVTCCKNNDGQLGDRSVWERCNGLFTSVSGFDWTAWDNGEKADDFTPDKVVEIVLRNSKGISHSKLVAEIKKNGVSQATAYRRVEKAEKSGAIRFQKGKDIYVLP